MGKSINIVSVTKVTIDNVVSEFTKKVKEYYPKTDKFVNVHFESPFNVDDEEFFDTIPLDGINRMAKPEVS